MDKEEDREVRELGPSRDGRSAKGHAVKVTGEHISCSRDTHEFGDTFQAFLFYP